MAPDLLPATATLAEIERMAIVQALQRTNWNKQDAALQLGLYRPTLYSKMKKHGITLPPRVRRRGPVEPRRVTGLTDGREMAGMCRLGVVK